MGSNRNCSRLDTLELKDHIFIRIGHQRAQKYFDQLKRFFSLKLSKSEFDKSCVRTIGRENISLHNRLIKAIIRNACHAKTPPQKSRSANIKVANGYQTTCLQSLYKLPQSPRKCRSPLNRKLRDRPSPLGPFGKSPSIVTCEEPFTRLQESATGLHSQSSKPPPVEDGEEVEQFSRNASVHGWKSITAPLGVSMTNCGTSEKGIICPSTHGGFVDSCENTGVLPDTLYLKRLLEKRLASEGLGVSLDCAKLINSSLEVFLKRLTEPCVSIARTRSNSSHVSMLDFRVAMESNPRLLGENWPIHYEKICQYASDLE